MNGVVREWVEKAEADYGMAQRELSAPERPNFDGICFHAQQCIEKLMKDLLIHVGVLPLRTHNLVSLYERLVPTCPGLTCSTDELKFLTHGAGALRYPGATAEREDAVEAMRICERLRQELLKRLGSG